MIKYKLSRKARSAGQRIALAAGPFVCALSCNAYEPSLTAGTAGLGGSGASAAAETAGSLATAGSGAVPTHMGGSESGSAGTAGIAAVGGAVGGKGGETSAVGGNGGAAIAGSAGSSGATTAGAGGGQAIQDSDPLDDMEDDDTQIMLSGGRNGFWYVGSDGTVGATTDPMGTFAMSGLAKDDHGSSMYAAHLKAVGFTGWGSVMGFNVVESLGTVKAYDASAYCGVQFWAKAAAPFTARFRAPDGDTHQAGGVCMDGGAANKACYDHFGAYVPLTTAWKAFPIRFTDLAQAGTGYHPADGKFRADQLYAIEWALPGGTAKTYELWIDDVEFIKCL